MLCFTCFLLSWSHELLVRPVFVDPEASVEKMDIEKGSLEMYTIQKGSRFVSHKTPDDEMS
jgi:hypothetical protein